MEIIHIHKEDKSSNSLIYLFFPIVVFAIVLLVYFSFYRNFRAEVAIQTTDDAYANTETSSDVLGTQENE